ncbi:MAG: PqqD family protein [Solobacterium sp.]|nr:PqqD family protein [Solobacterium sp.]
MNYKTTDGMVLECVCGQYVLIATLEARKTCPYITKINEDSAYIWKMLESKCTFDEMRRKTEKDYEISPEEAEETLRAFLDSLIKKGYVTEK